MNKDLLLAICMFFSLYTYAENHPNRIMLLVDMSSSMLTQDIKPDRLQSAKQLMKTFIKSHPTTPIGITAFAGEWENLSEPTLDHKYILSLLNKLELDSLQYSDGTATGSALICAASCLVNKQSNNAILLITDGVTNCGNLSTSTALDILKYYHIRLDVIAIGTNGKATYPYKVSKDSIQQVTLDTQLDSKRISKMAKSTGGFYFEVTSLQTFQNVLNKMKSPMPMKQSSNLPPSANFRMSKERIEWVIKKITE